jgi:class 3 adenylate cyclase
VAADIAGYSGLVGNNEEDTIRAFRAHRQELIDPLIDEYDGRVANTAGDSLLLEFPSAVDALRSAIAVQDGMADRNKDIESDRQIRFRIGINVGDVIVEGDDLLGDGVNVAARLQEMSEPGGICISSSVHEQVAGKIDQPFDDLGYHKLKNILHPVHVYRVHLADLPADLQFRSFFDRPPIEKSSLVTGGCMCGRIRYEIGQPAIETILCHCRMCQRFNSAPFSVWTAFSIEAVRFTKGEPTYYRSSLIGERGYCADCGSSLTMTYYAPEISGILAILAPTLDHPEDYAPTRHACVESMMPWLDLRDSLPRGRSTESPALRQRWAAVGLPDPADWK